jgi:hypothetical protein
MATRTPTILITAELAAETARLLDSFATERPSEGVVYWFGLEFDSIAAVTTLVVPDADTSGGGVTTSAVANAAAIGAIVGTPLVYLGQAHSHPGSHVGHSSVDDHETFARFDGAISVVVPWFGRYGFDLRRCGVHRHVGGRFQKVENLDAHIRVVPGLVDQRSEGQPPRTG